MKTVSFYTLGCRLNFSETGTISSQFKENGYTILPFEEQADVVFLNTCTVTDQADSTCLQLIKQARKNSPSGKIIVAGCYAQMESEKLKQIKDVDLILGTEEKFKALEYLKEQDTLESYIDLHNEFYQSATSLESSKTRAFLKIQDGCNYICSFCIIPFARGRSRVGKIQTLTEEAKKIINLGFQEIVLTGVNIGEFEKTGGERLEDLIESLSNLGLKRLRLSSVEPNTITNSLLQSLQQSDIYQNHFHIPLQSGSNTILKSMRRKYTSEQYLETLHRIKEYFPSAAIGADVICGFPGESEEDFLLTYNLIKNSPLTHLHVFPYAQRQKTTASKLPSQLSSSLKKERVRALIQLGEEKKEQYAKSLIGKVVEVLFEKKKNNLSQGYTPEFLKCFISENISENSIAKVVLTDYHNKELFGKIYEQ
jgi:threonylcarbamoyladenosine tRNA methylthiotransferase MtaB